MNILYKNYKVSELEDFLFEYWFLLGEPKATVIYNEFQPPLPRVSKRDIVAMKIWIPSSLTTDGKTGNQIWRQK